MRIDQHNSLEEELRQLGDMIREDDLYPESEKRHGELHVINQHDSALEREADNAGFSASQPKS